MRKAIGYLTLLACGLCTVGLFSCGGDDGDIIEPERVGALAVEETSLDFGETRTTQNFTVKNTGGRNLTWEASCDRDWVKLIPEEGTTFPGKNTVVRVEVDREMSPADGGLQAGGNTGTVLVSAENGTQTKSVEVRARTWYGSSDYFVSVQNGDDTSNDGKKDTPFKTIQHAINTASGTPGVVHVAEGVYSESIQLASHVSLSGGYANDTWERDPDAYETLIVSDWRSTVSASGKSSVTVDGFTIENAGILGPEDMWRAASIAVFLDNCARITFTNNRVRAGEVLLASSNGANGSKGDNGENGNPGWGDSMGKAGGGGDMRGGDGHSGEPVSCGWPGLDGDDAAITRGTCSPAPDPYWCGVKPPQFRWGCGGPGGQSCAGIGGRGLPGKDGCDGEMGATGSGGNPGSDLGRVTIMGYERSHGSSGSDGADGGGGGGGGGGGFGSVGGWEEVGGMGGGGGGGGYGGHGGSGGEGGRASIAALVFVSAEVVFSDNEIKTGKGGDGGRGGTGADGGGGGTGGAGYPTWGGYAGDGGTGGDGGAGGRGGHGGGGGGGPSIGIIVDVAASAEISDNTFILGGGGTGGYNPADGTHSPNGKTAQVLDLSSLSSARRKTLSGKR